MLSLPRRKFFSALASLGATVIAPRVIKIQAASMYGVRYYGAGSAAMAILRADFGVYDYRSRYYLHDIKTTR